MQTDKTKKTKQEKQAEMLRYNLVLRKKQIEERERLKKQTDDKKSQKQD